MKKAVLIALIVFSGRLQGQLDELTLREAESIVERVPAVAAAEKKGECPQLSGAYWTGDEVQFQVRRACGPDAGTLINPYLVNRRTGAVSMGEAGEPALDRAGRAFATRLLALARARRLSADEARCIALEGARSLPGWGGNDAVVSVQPLPTPQVRPLEADVAFTALNRPSSRPLQSARPLTVNLSTGQVRDDETGLSLVSAELGALVAKIVALRAPLVLSDKEAISIALSVPSVAEKIPEGCRLSGGGAYNPNEVVAGPNCEGRSGDWSVTVNLSTGEVRDAETRKIVDATKAGRLAREILDERKRQSSQLREEVDAFCRVH